MSQEGVVEEIAVEQEARVALPVDDNLGHLIAMVILGGGLGLACVRLTIPPDPPRLRSGV